VWKFMICLLLVINFAYAQNGHNGGTSLGEALYQQKETFVERMPKEVVKVYDDNIKTLKKAGIEKEALNVGDKAPQVNIPLDGEPYPLANIYGTGPLVLKFYRGGWCVYCMTELKHYEAMYDEFKAAGAQIVAISPDTAEKIQRNRVTGNLSFDVISDEDHAIARAFNLVYQLEEKMIERLKADGIDLSVYQGKNGDEDQELAIPATYVIDTDGRIAFAYIDADYRQRVEPSDVLKVIKKMKKSKK
jgi:peroxiredoxin